MTCRDGDDVKSLPGLLRQVSGSCEFDCCLDFDAGNPETGVGISLLRMIESTRFIKLRRSP
jgi:hypothetical protein